MNILKIPLYFEEDDKPYTELILKGEGAYPKLLFDVDEVILDVIPLNTVSSYILNIYNDGYMYILSEGGFKFANLLLNDNVSVAIYEQFHGMLSTYD